MVLVFDASGSMWGQIDGKAKITIAKEVLADLIDQMPADFHTGLTVYGHRRKGDCNDIEMVIPVGPHNPTAMKSKIKAINPKGKTPLSEAVKQAAKALQYTKQRATVVLVSDGLETCNIDPCKLASELAMSGVDFTIHVVGFGISKEEQDQLKCLAEKTGGLFLSADNAGSLRDALFKTIEKVKEKPLPVIEDPGTATLKGPETTPASSSFNVDWQGPDSRNDLIAIAKKGSHDGKRDEYTYTKKGNPAVITAPGEPGDYELRYVHSHSRKVIGRTDIKIIPVKASVEAPASVKVGTEFNITWKGPGYKNDFITISQSGEHVSQHLARVIIKHGNTVNIQAPGEPGEYEIRYILFQDRKILATAPITLKPVTAEIIAPATVKAGAYFHVEWKGPGGSDDFLTIALPSQAPNMQVVTVYLYKGNPLKMRAPKKPGTYEVRYILFQGRKLLGKATIQVVP